MKKNKKVIVAMSGGVDSSVAAYLLKKRGYHVEGLFMKNWEEDDNDQNCNSKKDLSDAKIVCEKLSIKLHTINFSSEYWDNVFERFLSEYKNGRTPNPDILCNKEIKFKTFLEFAFEDLNANFIATGHYVRRENVIGKYQLLRGVDSNKDQSYFLYALNYRQIKKSIFPLGNMRKSEVRNIAKKLELITANKKDSTGICFIGKRKFQEFLSRYIPEKPGKIVTVEGNILSQHRGAAFYTLGQRKGLHIGGIKGRKKEPWYVVDKDINNNILVVAQGRNHPRLMSTGLIANQCNWIHQDLKKEKIYCTAKTRYCQIDTPCTVTQINHERIKVYFKYPVVAVTPGQSVVFYDGEICLGGGIIEKRILLNA